MKTPEWVIVIGGSAGALPALRTIVSALPADIPAACLVVVHTSATGGVYLPSLIRRWTSWRVVAIDRPQPLHAGAIYIPSPDRHLKVTPTGAEATRDAREHHMRPAVDVLFRSAARAFGARTIAVVLSGFGGDGAAGAISVRSRGGAIVVQHPDDADVPSMPLRTRATGAVTLELPASEIASSIQQLMSRTEAAEGAFMTRQEQVSEVIANDIAEQKRGARSGEVSVVSCPDCGGVMWQTTLGTFVDFACHIGHRYSSDTLLVQKTEQLEAALVTALRLLKEKAILIRQAANRARDNGQTRAAERLDEQASVDERYAEVLQRELLEAEPSPLSDTVVDEEVANVDAGDGASGSAPR